MTANNGSFQLHHPNLLTGTGEVTASRQTAEQTYLVEFTAPELAKAVKPGQFVMVRLSGLYAPLLGRPFAVYTADQKTGRVQVIYLVVGRMTGRLCQIELGTKLEWWGPLGNGWQAVTAGLPCREDGYPYDHLIMAAGGIGYTPFYLLAQECATLSNPPKLTLLYGARTKTRLADLSDFQKLGIQVRIATDDGTEGEKGNVADLLNAAVAESFPCQKTVIAACGPHPMLAAVFHTAEQLGNIPCYTSLETPMSCGMGLCFGCVIEYRGDDGKPDYRRTCIDGPVFDAYRLYW